MFKLPAVKSPNNANNLHTILQEQKLLARLKKLRAQSVPRHVKLDLYHGPLLCLLGCSRQPDAAFGGNEPRLSTDSPVPERGRCLSSCLRRWVSCLGPSLKLPRGSCITQTTALPPHHDSAHVHVCTKKYTKQSEPNKYLDH